MWCLYVYASVCRGPETQITFKTFPPNSRSQNLFKTSITHFYFFTYRVPSPESWVSTNPSPKSQHLGFKLLTGVPTVKESNGKKKPGVGRVAPRYVEPWE
jgi:hypothetical protein